MIYSECKLTLELQGGKTYSLAQFHVHSPSEHTIEGHHYSGEIHFVHKEDGGSGLLVTGLLLNPEQHVKENEWLEKVWESMSEGEEDRAVPVDLEYVTIVICLPLVFNYQT